MSHKFPALYSPSDVLSSLFKEGKYSDCTIRCQDRVWKLHRNIVCTQSDVLAAALDGNFKEGATKEVNLEDDESEIVHLMLYFMYTGIVDIKTGATTGGLFGSNLSSTETSSSSSGAAGTGLFGPPPPASVLPNSTLRATTPSSLGTGGLFGSGRLQNNSQSTTAGIVGLFGNPVSQSTTQATPPSLGTGGLFGGSGLSQNIQTTPSVAAGPRSIFAPSATQSPPPNPSSINTAGLFGSTTSQNNSQRAPSGNSVTNSTSSATFRGFSFATTSTSPFGINSSTTEGGLFSIPSNPAVPTSQTQESTHLSMYANELVRLAKLYVLAEKLNVQSLKFHVQVKYQLLLPKTCYTSWFVDSLKLILDGTPETTPPDPMRILVIKTAGENAKALVERKEFVRLCRENTDFATNVLMASLGKYP